jgi:putative two-component system response regulator
MATNQRLRARSDADAILQALPTPVVVLDAAGRVLRLNPAASRAAGATPAAARGVAFADLFPPHSEPVSRFAREADDERILTVAPGDEEGSVLAWSTATLPSEPGEVLIAADVRGRLAAERRAEIREARLTELLDHVPCAAYLKDAEGRYVFVNRQMQEVAQRHAVELLGARAQDIFGPDAAREAESLEEAAQRTRRPQLSEHILADAGERHYVSEKFPLFAADGAPEGTGGVATEITERVQVETQLHSAYRETVGRLARAVEFRDNDTGEHVERMSMYCGLIAEHLGLPAERSDLIRNASVMHDAGKIAIPDRILLKPGPLDADERALMETHTTIGHDLLAGSTSPLLQIASLIAYSHHERYDGTGYPCRLRGEDIPLEARIAAVADVFEALTANRVYRPALSWADAVATMIDGRGTHFDPDVLDPFIDALTERRSTAGAER